MSIALTAFCPVLGSYMCMCCGSMYHLSRSLASLLPIIMIQGSLSSQIVKPDVLRAYHFCPHYKRKTDARAIGFQLIFSLRRLSLNFGFLSDSLFFGIVEDIFLTGAISLSRNI